MTFVRILPLSLLLAISNSCTSDREITRPQAIDIFDKFTARRILAPDVLPNNLTVIKFIPGKNEFVALGKAGQVFHFVRDDTAARFLGSFTIPDVAPAPVEVGLTGLAFDPDFENNRFLYMCYTTGDNHLNRIIRLQWVGSYGEIEQSIQTVIEIDRIFPEEPEHGIYDICFGGDGMLYAAIGDATQPEFPQNPQSLLGKLLRIEPASGETAGYTIPDDNPYLDDDRFLPEIAALGLRTPFRLLCWQDKIFIADVGQNRYEEINAYTLGKKNFGWPFCEGYCEGGGYQNPILAVSHADPIYQTEDPGESSNNGLSISLAVAYPNSGADPYNDLLDGRLIFNDVFQGYVRAGRIEDNGQLTDDQHIFHLDFVTSMAIAPDGFIYASTIFPSQLFRIELRN